MRAQAAATRRGDPVPPPRRLLGQRHGRLEGARTSSIAELGPRMAAVRGISHCYQRPTYPDWPYSVFTMAHGRSKQECDAVLDGVGERLRPRRRRSRDALLVDRVQEGAPALLHSRLRGVGSQVRMTGDAVGAASHVRSHELYQRALGVLPGGVNSPVRAMRAIGREPLFIAAAAGAEIDRRRRQPLHRLRLLVGPDDRRPRAPARGRGGRGGRRARDQLRRADRGRGRAGRARSSSACPAPRWCGWSRRAPRRR